MSAGTAIIRLAPTWDTAPHRAWLERIDDHAAAADQVIYRGRNTIVRLDVLGEAVAVKRFPPLRGLKRWIYRWRPSKALRSFDHAMRLLDLGIATPQPWAVCERRDGGALTAAHYVCAFIADARQGWALKDAALPDRAAVVERFGAFVARLHERGVLHHDLTPGNVLLPPAGSLDEFALIDINRMAFGPVDASQGIANLAQLGFDDDALIAGYCRVRGLPAGWLHARLRAQLRVHRWLWRVKDGTRAWRRRLVGRA